MLNANMRGATKPIIYCPTLNIFSMPLSIPEKIKAIASVCCSYPYEVVNLLNNYGGGRTKLLDKYVIEIQDDADYIKVYEEYDLFSICYDNTEDRIIVNYRIKRDPSEWYEHGCNTMLNA